MVLHFVSYIFVSYTLIFNKVAPTFCVIHKVTHCVIHFFGVNFSVIHTKTARFSVILYDVTVSVVHGAGTALVVHAKNSRPRRASNPHQTPWIHIKIFISACPFPKEETFEDFWRLFVGNSHDKSLSTLDKLLDFFWKMKKDLALNCTVLSLINLNAFYAFGRQFMEWNNCIDIRIYSQ